MRLETLPFISHCRIDILLGQKSRGLSVGSTVDFLLNWDPARHHHESRHVAASQNKGIAAPSLALSFFLQLIIASIDALSLSQSLLGRTASSTPAAYEHAEQVKCDTNGHNKQHALSRGVRAAGHPQLNCTAPVHNSLGIPANAQGAFIYDVYG